VNPRLRSRDLCAQNLEQRLTRWWRCWIDWYRRTGGCTSATPRTILIDRFESQRIEKGLIRCSFSVVNSQAYAGVDHDWSEIVGS
jgi:hypothetical protein